MDVNEEFAEEIRGKLREALQRCAEKRGWMPPSSWADDVLGAIQNVFDREQIEIARSIIRGVANPAHPVRLTKS
ncbi:MAG TPA: hypothetical protein VHC73_10885 [Vitreimonas sp.]|jgi:hypothetical protein|nr:hypothetical protein [Vitreimonas sp.]